MNDVALPAGVRPVRLSDKYVLDQGRVYLTGIQALVRLPMDRVRLDRAAGLRTGGFISGYRGSPLAGYDQQLLAAAGELAAHDVRFTPGVNEELAATAVWGSQKTVSSGSGSDFDGVFGLWYGKAPGVDRSTDVFKHANASGTSRHGGVLAIAGDDHLAKSSTVACQSQFQFADCEIPVLEPADLQDVVDFGLLGLEMSRFSGLWVGMIALADTMDSSGVVDVSLARHVFRRPRAEFDPRARADVDRPMLLRHRLDNEVSVREIRLPAARAFARANELDGPAFGATRPRIGFVAAGKAYRDLRQAFDLVGLDEARARVLGVAIFKVGMSWPLEPIAISSFARGLERLVVVEHKRPLIEAQIKELAYPWPEHQRPAIWGKTSPSGEPFLSSVRELASADLVPAVMAVVPGLGDDERARGAAEALVAQAMWAAGHGADARRSPYFCAGCPHNTSTKTPEGARSMAGIGCHAMTELAERTTDGLTAMGGEGVPWVGQAAFSRDGHVFANLGDGTWFHSGALAIRQSVVAGVNITYKILFNDAVAMTGGQKVDGGALSVGRLTRSLEAEGVAKIVVVADDWERHVGSPELAGGVEVRPRRDLLLVEKELAATPGVTVLVYDQTCAAEKRRRRKRGAMVDPAKRIFVNERVCEDCGDCSKQSNCIAVEPIATEFGRKRRIDQATCNKDFSCATGFCPSFVEVIGGRLKREGRRIDPAALVAGLPTPARASVERGLDLMIAGIGGMGVTTAAAVLAMAAHVDGIDVTTLDMTGLAQKGGPVTSHVRFSVFGRPIEGPRVPTAGLDVLIASDMLVAAGAETLAYASPTKTSVFADARLQTTAEFVLRQTQSFTADGLSSVLTEASARFERFPAGEAAERLFGDTLAVNLILIGAALQAGRLPISLPALEAAVRLNGAAVETNLAALALGRALVAAPERVGDFVAPRPSIDVAAAPLGERIERLAGELVAWGGARVAADYRAAISALRTRETAVTGGETVTRIAAEQLFRLTAIKDEWEVARLHADPAFAARLAETFEDVREIRTVLAPPFLARIDPATGRPQKLSFGPWIRPVLGAMARLRGLRGSWLDLFGRTAERREERAVRDLYRADLRLIADRLAEGRGDVTALGAFAGWPREARGYGPVKAAGMAAARATREALLARLDIGEVNPRRAAE
ncbi:MAG: indolepyruvate ferredoxin oxidoreductase family protein [Hyphomicrobiales bacterium]|nr:indolepyruvate ferredoxin oxidoreductase family protein [Hyphomicrobiales bacterium]